MTRRAAAALALLGPMLVMRSACAAKERAMTLTLTHPLRTGESAFLEVRLGPIRRGQQIYVTTAAGERLGVISPFGVRPGQDAGTYTLPLPPLAIHGDRVCVALAISQLDGGRPRVPTAQEVRGVKLVVTGE